MNEKIKSDYIRFIFRKTRSGLNRYNISSSDKELINNLFNRLLRSENLLRDIYVISHIKDLKNVGRYLTFILKKIEDDVITFDNLLQNLDSDTEYIENELLNFLSNPALRESIDYGTEEEIFTGELKTGAAEKTYEKGSEETGESEETEFSGQSVSPDTEEEEISDFKKNYLELIQSEEDEEETVYELPTSAEGDTTQLFSGSEDREEETDDIGTTTRATEDTQISESGSSGEEMQEVDAGLYEGTEVTAADSGEEPSASLFEEPAGNDIREDTGDVSGEAEAGSIRLSDEISEELKLFEEQQKIDVSEQSIFEEATEEKIEEPPANAAFIEFEAEVKENNDYLNEQFEKMITALSGEPGTDETREELIRNILERSIHIESISRNMSLEVISNIYQTITLSFEKISDGKYDLSESTLNLFRKGLSLVISLIKGDDYFGYKDILKSIENIRSSLIEEKEKREQYMRQLKEKEELKKRINEKYPEDSQKVKVASLKKLIKDTETNFNSLDKISGEYQIYEALRSLSGNLNNFKDMVIISKELGLNKLVQLAEASYIFLKFLQNYRINPVSIESKEIFGYIIYNLKSIVVGKQAEDLDIFISYLNDPVKIFSKTGKKKN